MGVDRVSNRIVQILSSFVALVGIAVIGSGVAVFIQFAGSMRMLAQGLSMWLGIFITIYGILIVLTAMIPIEATAGFADVQGYFSGKFRLTWAIVLVFFIACFSAYVTYRLYLYQLILSHNLSTLQEISNSISFNNDDYQTSEQIKAQSMEVAINTVEESIGKVFNYLFAHGGSDCDVNSGWFWAWVDSHCPSNIHHDRCMKCPTYTLSYCAADVSTCSSSSSADTCAYNICREGILEFLLQYPLQYAIYVAGGLTILYLCECLAMSALAFCTRVADKRTIRVVPLGEDEEENDLNKFHAIEENDNTDNDEEKQVENGTKQTLPASNYPYPSDANDISNNNMNYSTTEFMAPTEPQQQLHLHFPPHSLPPQEQPSYSQQILQQYHLAGFLSPIGDNTDIMSPPLQHSQAPQPTNIPYSMTSYGQPTSDDTNNSSFLPHKHAGTSRNNKNMHNLSSVTEDEQLQLALALTLVADRKDPAFRSNNSHQFLVSNPDRALKCSEDNEDMQMALALSKSTASNLGNFSYAKSNTNTNVNNNFRQNRTDHLIKEEEDDLQLALALSLSTAENKSYK